MQKEKHKKAKELLNKIDLHRDNSLIIHYSCESFVCEEKRNSPRIISIAVLNLGTGQVQSFSIHMVAERVNQMDNILEIFDSLEKAMLDDFYDFVKEHLSCIWIHWNMRDINYGFQAIDHRYRVLNGIPIVIPDDRKYDLANLFVDYYGRNYIEHPRMKNLVQKNNISDKDYLSGAEEAKEISDGNYSKVNQSTLRKVQVFATFIDLAINNQLKTNSKWYEKTGINPQGIYEYYCQTWWFQIIVNLLNIVFGICLERFLINRIFGS